MEKVYSVVVIGGGAAGFFAACRAKALNRDASVAIIEQSKPLQKVLISGGGRCNVTHACFDPSELVTNYPRGHKELLGPFHQFGPGDCMHWFEDRGIPLKIEDDGRVFPQSNRSDSIANCLLLEAKKLGIELITGERVNGFKKEGNSFITTTKTHRYQSRKIMIATGSSRAVWKMLQELGHTIIEDVPSLFTFHLNPHPFKGLEGLSFKSHLSIPQLGLREEGDVLITHWGLSGPAILRLSAWGARLLHATNYAFSLLMEIIPDAHHWIEDQRKTQASVKTLKQRPEGLPKRLWENLLLSAKVDLNKRWADLNKNEIELLAEQLSEKPLQVNGKSTFKEEFVTAGGVALNEINFKSMESKVVPDLYLAGEVVDIDAITGGFNFQNAWTCGWIAGESMSKTLRA